MIQKIKDKLDSIPIFFKEEKAYILDKLNGKPDETLQIIFDELLIIEKNVQKDFTKLQKSLKEIEDDIKIEIEAKKRHIIKNMIKMAEENDNG